MKGLLKDKKIVLIGSIAYILGIYLAYFLYSPSISFNAIKHAMQQKDVELLDDYIDFSSIQLGVMNQLKNELILKAAENKIESKVSSPLFIANVSNSINMLEDFLGLLFSKNGLSRLFDMDENNLRTSAAIETRKYISNLQSESFISKDGFDFISFRKIEVNGYSENEKQHKLIFTFRYTRWILTDIRMGWGDIDSEKITKFIKEFK